MQHREIFRPPIHIIDSGTCLIHVNVKYFPQNLSSLVQPLDSGVIRSLKAHTRTLQVKDLLIFLSRIEEYRYDTLKQGNLDNSINKI